MNRIINILLVVVLVLVAVALLSSSAAAQPNTNANVNVTPDGSVYGSAYEISFNCKDESSSSFVVHNYTSEPLENQEAYIEVDGQTLPVNRVEAGGYTFIEPAVLEGEVDLYVNDTLVDSAVVGGRECNPPQNESSENATSGQYSQGNSGNQYASQNPSNNNGGDQYGNNGSDSSQPKNDGSQASSTDNSNEDIEVLPDTGGAGWFSIIGGSLLVTGGLLARRLLR